MKPNPTPKPGCRQPYGLSWPQVYARITALLLLFLAAVHIADWLKGLLP